MNGFKGVDSRTWIDADGLHVWFAHNCVNARSATMLPYPMWQRDDAGKLWPSVSCGECGTHVLGLVVEGAPEERDRCLMPEVSL